MREPALTDPATEVSLGERRAEVLARLQWAGRSLTVAEVAEATRLHPNTARFHLDGLVADGLAERAPEARGMPGRPKILYMTRRQTEGPRSYRLLAEMLTGLVAGLKEAGPAALEAGRSWGRHLVERPAPSERLDAGQAIDRLNRLLGSIGFDPEIAPGKTGRETEVRLHHCPFRDVAERHTDLVCSIHLGLIQGALAELGAPVEASTLQPFVTPNLCVARLRASPGRRKQSRGRTGT